MRKNDNRVTIAAITRAVNISSRYSWPVIVGFLLVTIVSVGYLVRHFAITTDSNKLLSSSLPWRQQEIMLDRAFPQRIDQIIAVIDATTPEAAGEAADALVKDLSSRSDVIRTITQPDGGEFFARNGILFLTTDEVRRNTAELIAAQPFLGTLASDPTLRLTNGAHFSHHGDVRPDTKLVADVDLQERLWTATTALPAVAALGRFL